MSGPTLVEFLRARLDEDEATARECLSREPGFTRGVYGGHWSAVDPDEGTRLAGRFGEVATLGITLTAWPDTAAHIARHDPARVLADVKAKRAIVARHSLHPHYPVCEWCFVSEPVFKAAPFPCIELRTIASVYADHSDYQDEWKP